MIAIIPARAGSKRIPGKNTKPFKGVPLLSRTIQLAQESKLFDEVIVSSESETILALARIDGAEAYMRPEELATDEADTECVLLDVLDHHPATDCICCIYCAAGIFITPQILRDAYQRFAKWYQPIGQHLISYLREGRDAGQFYFLNADILRAQYAQGVEILQQKHRRYYVDAIDINTPEEWAQAEEWWEEHRA